MPAQAAERADRRLPRGVHGLPLELALAAQRARIVEATAHVVAGKGYADATVADIIGCAGISRATFYQVYRDKEDCFLSCFSELAESHLQVLRVQLDRRVPHPERLVAALGAWMERIDADPRFARAFIGEAESATPAIRAAWRRARARLEDSLRLWLRRARAEHPALPDPGTTLLELVNGGIAALVVDAVRGGRPLVPLVPQIACFVFDALGMPAWSRPLRRRGAAR